MGLFDFLKGGAAARTAGEPAPAGPPPCASSGGTGCLLCGKELVRLDRPKQLACALCGVRGPADSRCKDGHHVCEACDASPAADVIERACAASEERDPVALALRLLRHPALQRRSADHDLLVTAVLVATWSNATGEPARRAERVAETRRRATAPRAAGGAAAAGAFASIAGEASGADAALAERITDRVRAIVGDADAGRCCKRESLLSVLAAAKLAREHLQVDLPAQGIGCETSGRSKDCEGSGCPFNR